MELTTTQIYEIEQQIYKARKIEAIKLYREATNESLRDAKDAVEDMTQHLMKEKPWMFNEKNTPKDTSRKSIRKSALIIFFLVDSILFAAAIYWFVFYQADSNNVSSNSRIQVDKTTELVTATTPAVNVIKDEKIVHQNKVIKKIENHSLPKIMTKKEVVKISQNSLSLINPDKNEYSASISPTDTFLSLYQAKLIDKNYQKRKNNSQRRRTYDNSLVERKIKTLRSQLAAQRIKPVDQKLLSIPLTHLKPQIDGKIQQKEWLESLALDIGGEQDTTIYLQSDGTWLYIACDVRDEMTASGYDQFRVYFHAGLIAEMVNERIHLGRGKHVTSIRQTTVYWQGEEPQNKNERWKKYGLSDWGLYKYAVGSSDMHGNRHYEIAINLAEVGLHLEIPFTLSAEVETDPQKNKAGKFIKRQYLGFLGSKKMPIWFAIEPL